MNVSINFYKNKRDKFYVTDNNGKKILSGLTLLKISKEIENRDSYPYPEVEVYHFRTKNNEFSCITSKGLFFNKYSYKEYEFVCELVPTIFIKKDIFIYDLLKVKKNGKYGIISYSYNYFRYEYECIYDEITLLSNYFFDAFSPSIKLKKEGKYVISDIGNLHSKKYDYIFTPIQPLDKYIVCENGKYGFIESEKFNEIVSPTFDSIEELCNTFKCCMRKYTIDLYNKKKKINIQFKKHPYLSMSYVLDENKLVKGIWGGAKNILKEKNTNETNLYELYFSEKMVDIPINKYGYFYNLFDCRVYDGIIHVESKFYLFIINNKYGLIDDEFNIYLPACYENIELANLSDSKDIVFIITYNQKQFVYNATLDYRFGLYDAIYNKQKNVWEIYKNCYVYKENGLYGLISNKGEIIVKARFQELKCNHRDKGTCGTPVFTEKFHGREYEIFIKDKKYYGLIPIEKYDYCIKILRFYITVKNGKYGLLNYRCEPFNLPLLDDIIYENRGSIFLSSNYACYKKITSKGYIIGIMKSKYNLYFIPTLDDSPQCVLILENCDEMEFITEGRSEYFTYVKFKKNGIDGYVNEDGIIISLNKYDNIEALSICRKDDFFLIYKDQKVGLLDYKRKVVLDCIYDDIRVITNSSVIAVMNEVEQEVSIRPYPKKLPRNYDLDNDPRTYSIYSGSYAQDIMGYSDDDIDTIFDGDPDAYWNID